MVDIKVISYFIDMRGCLHMCVCVFLYHVHSANSGTASAVLTEEDGPLDLKLQIVVSLQWAFGTQPGFLEKQKVLLLLSHFSNLSCNIL